MRACSGQSLSGPLHPLGPTTELTANCPAVVPPMPISTPISATTEPAQSATTETATTIDRATVLQLFSRLLQDLYGTMGGPVALGELDVVAIEPAQGGQDNKSSEVVIRFPAGCVSRVSSLFPQLFRERFSANTQKTSRSATHAILTALPLATSSPFRLSVLRHSSDLSRLVGPAGHGPRGYAQWVSGVKAMAMAAVAEKEQPMTSEEVEIQHAA